MRNQKTTGIAKTEKSQQRQRRMNSRKSTGYKDKEKGKEMQWPMLINIYRLQTQSWVTSLGGWETSFSLLLPQLHIQEARVQTQHFWEALTKMSHLLQNMWMKRKTKRKEGMRGGGGRGERERKKGEGKQGRRKARKEGKQGKQGRKEWRKERRKSLCIEFSLLQ